MIDAIVLPDESRIVSVPSDEFARVLDVMETAFPDTARSFFSNITLLDPWYQPHFSLAVENGNLFLAHAQIFDRTLIWNESPVRFGGIGSVGTRPNSRGRGYAKALMRAASDVMEQAGMAGSFLYTEIHPFYESLGWKTIRQWEQEIPCEPLKQWRPPLSVYRPIRETDYPQLNDLYTRQSSRMNGTMERTLEYWRVRPKWMNHTGTAIVEDGRIAAYFYAAKYREEQPVMHVTEFGFNRLDEFLFRWLSGAAAWKAEEMGCDTIRGLFLPDPAFGSFLQTENLISCEMENTYMMWKDFGRSDFWESFQKAADDRRFIYWQTDAF